MVFPSPAEMYCMLKPWFEHARLRMSLSVDMRNKLAQDDDTASGFWINWNLPLEDTRSQAKKWGVMDIEAMELLDLFVRVDYGAGWDAILEALKIPSHLRSRLRTTFLRGQMRLCPRFRICDLESLEADLYKTFKAFLDLLAFEVNPFEHMTTFFAVRQAFVQHFADRHNGSERVILPRKSGDRIHVELGLWDDGTSSATVGLILRTLLLHSLRTRRDMVCLPNLPRQIGV